jgi:hypothetical protein
MNNVELTKEVETLKEQVAQLQAMLSIVGMPYEFKEIIRNEVIEQEDEQYDTTENIVLPIEGDPEIEVGKIQSGYLIIKWRGKDYRIAYYV